MPSIVRRNSPHRNVSSVRATMMSTPHLLVMWSSTVRLGQADEKTFAVVSGQGGAQTETTRARADRAGAATIGALRLGAVRLGAGGIGAVTVMVSSLPNSGYLPAGSSNRYS